jgi:hypothetical protein
MFQSEEMEVKDEGTTGIEIEKKHSSYDIVRRPR